MKINYYSKLRRYTETISVTATENRIYVRRRKKKRSGFIKKWWLV